MTDGPIIVVDSDEDDKEILSDACRELNLQNEFIFFENGKEVLEYLHSDLPTPFVILCDVNIPGMDGFKLKEKILEESSTNYKSIPFVFWSTEVSKSQIQRAYDLGVNGFFVKENTFEGIKQSLRDIINYWAKSKVPG